MTNNELANAKTNLLTYAMFELVLVKIGLLIKVKKT